MTSSEQELLAENAALRATVAAQQDELARLRHNFDVLRRMLFGPRSEKRAEPVDEAQGVLALGDVAAADERAASEQGAQVDVSVPTAIPETSARRPARRSAFPNHLPRVRSRFQLPEASRACACGAALAEIGEEVTQELERVEISIVHEIARVKYACSGCKEKVVTAPGPARVIDKGMLGVGFLAHLLSERFAHHMPYHRLEKKYESEGLSLSRSVLCNAAGRCAELLDPVYRRLLDDVLAQPVVGTDDTNVIIQEGSHGGSRRGHLWLYRDLDGRCVFDFTESRSRDGPARILRDFRGYLQADAYGVYDAFFVPGGPTEVGCWAHARRKFVVAEASDPTLAGQAVERIAALYGVEKEAKDLSPEERLRARTRARPLLEDLFSWMGRVRSQVLDRSPMAEALDYALKNRAALSRYLEDGRLPIDNNGVERALRCVAVGRKNWMMVGNEEGGRRAAVLFSLVQTCREIGVDPRQYFRDVLLRISTCSDVSKLTPHGWKQHFAAQVDAERARALERLVVGAS